MRRLPRFATVLCMLAATGPAWAAATVDRVEIVGLDDELMIENVNAALSLNGFVIGPLVAALFVASWNLFGSRKKTVRLPQ